MSYSDADDIINSALGLLSENPIMLVKSICNEIWKYPFDMVIYVLRQTKKFVILDGKDSGLFSMDVCYLYREETICGEFLWDVKIRGASDRTTSTLINKIVFVLNKKKVPLHYTEIRKSIKFYFKDSYPDIYLYNYLVKDNIVSNMWEWYFYMKYHRNRILDAIRLNEYTVSQIARTSNKSSNKQVIWSTENADT